MRDLAADWASLRTEVATYRDQLARCRELPQPVAAQSLPKSARAGSLAPLTTPQQPQTVAVSRPSVQSGSDRRSQLTDVVGAVAAAPRRDAEARTFLALYRADRPVVKGFIVAADGARILLAQGGGVISCAEGDRVGDWQVVHVGERCAILLALSPPAAFFVGPSRRSRP